MGLVFGQSHRRHRRAAARVGSA